MRGIAPYNLLVATLVLVAGAVGGDPEWALMAAAAAILWSSALFISLEGFQVSAAHFVERHGLLVIIALGESIVALGVGSEHARVDGDDALIAILGLALSTALWWAHFATRGASRTRWCRPRSATAPGSR
jgi:low temperature requirement protein LtrA